eukprot:7143675-Pyramimonas_sp.AAC.1
MKRRGRPVQLRHRSQAPGHQNERAPSRERDGPFSGDGGPRPRVAGARPAAKGRLGKQAPS